MENSKELLENLKERIELTLANSEDYFNDFINVVGGVDVEILGYTFQKSRILKELDPIAYDEAKYEYVSNEMEDCCSELDDIEIDESDEESKNIKEDIEFLLDNF